MNVILFFIIQVVISIYLSLVFNSIIPWYEKFVTISFPLLGYGILSISFDIADRTSGSSNIVMVLNVLGYSILLLGLIAFIGMIMRLYKQK